MSGGQTSLAGKTDEEIAALIETLLATERRLEQLTEGEVDTLTGRDGRIFMLRRSQEHFRQSQAAKQAAILNALPAHIALLDARGIIISVNEAWRRFGISEVVQSPGHAIGCNYIEICSGAQGDGASEARQAAVGIRAVLDGAQHTVAIEYSCHSPTEQRWFLLTVTPLTENSPNGVVITHWNITERRQAAEIREELSKKTERRERILNTALSSMSDFAQIYDRECRLIFANQPLLELWGQTLEEVVGKDFFDLGYSDELAAKLQRQVQEVFETKRSITDEALYCSPGGMEGYYEYVFSPVFANDGTVDLVVGSTRNITDRRKAEMEIRFNEQRYRSLVEATTAIVWETPASGEFEVDQPSWRAFTGQSFEEHRGWGWLNAIHPDDRDETARVWSAALANRSLYKVEHRLRARDNTYHDMVVRAVPILAEDASIRQWFGVHSDVTQRKRASALLMASQQRLALATESAQMGIWEWDIVANKLVWDAQMYELYGISREDFTGAYTAWQNGLHPEDRDRGAAEIAAALAGVREFHTEFRVVWPNGELRHIEAHGLVLRSSEGSATHMIGVSWGITERKEAEAELQKTNMRLLEISRQAGKAEVATGILHNVGNVLNSVNVAASLLAARIRMSKVKNLSKVVTMFREHEGDLGAFLTNDPKGKQLLSYLTQLATHFAEEQVAALNELTQLQKNIEHIKDIVSLQQAFAKVSGLVETHHVTDLVEDALRMDSGGQAHGEIQIIKEFDNTPTLKVEKHKLLQILMNLVRNAKQACHATDRPEKRLTLRVTADVGRVRIAVRDNGVGISPENLARIFGHGFTTKKDGHGFGLHTAALAAKEMGGSLSVHSDGPSQGATFTIELPLEPPRKFDA